MLAAVEPYKRVDAPRSLLQKAGDKAKELTDKTKEAAGKARDAVKDAADKAKSTPTPTPEKK